MSIRQLRPPVVAGAVAAARDRVSEAAAVPSGSVPTSELGEAIGALSELESQVVALRYALSAEADERGVSELTADTGTDYVATTTAEPTTIGGTSGATPPASTGSTDAGKRAIAGPVRAPPT